MQDAYHDQSSLVQDVGLCSHEHFLCPCMFQVSVGLPSGRSEEFSIPQSSKVGDFQILAPKSCPVGFLRLVTAEGRQLVDPTESLQWCGVQNGDHLTAIVLEAKPQVEEAFALWCYGGDKILTWGNPEFGGDNSQVQDQLRRVQQLQATGRAFAAILADGSVITWGHPGYGGDSSEVRDQLQNVRQVQATESAFAAIRADGSAVTWGDPDAGGVSTEIQEKLNGVQQIQATGRAFAAILADGHVVTWGSESCGGDSSEVRVELRTVQQIQATGHAFAAILANGSVVTWGHPAYGGDSSKVRDKLGKVRQIPATSGAFAAILTDGSVVTWGDPICGGDSSDVQHRHVGIPALCFGHRPMDRGQLSGVQQIQATGRAFAAILSDGHVVTWGCPFCGGDSSDVRLELRSVQAVQATARAFAAILSSGSVVTWGHPGYGGDSCKVRDNLYNVWQIQATESAFAAIRADGSAIAWGASGYTGAQLMWFEITAEILAAANLSLCFGSDIFLLVLLDVSIWNWLGGKYASLPVKVCSQNIYIVPALGGAVCSRKKRHSLPRKSSPDHLLANRTHDSSDRCSYGKASSPSWSGLFNFTWLDSEHAFKCIQ